MRLRTRVTTAWERVGPRTVDAAFVLIGLAAAGAEALARRHEAVAVWSLVGATAALGALSLWWRRSHPVVVTLIGLVTFAATGLPVVIAVGLVTLATQRRDRVLAALTLAAVATFVVFGSIGNDRSWANLVVLGTIEAGFCVALGAYVGVRRDLVVALRERAERAEADQEVRAGQARLAERSRIAREMHDVLAHKVSLIAMHAGALEVQRDPSPQQVAATAALIRGTAREAMDELREVLGVLRATSEGPDLTPPPRRDDLVRAVEASRAAGVHAELQMEVDDLPDALARTAHRVVQEGLTNVHKHACGARALVTIRGGEASGVTVEVVNRRPLGGGAPLLPGSGAGLLGLRERVDLLGGTLQAGTCPDGGWRLVAWLPWGPPSVGRDLTGPR